MNHVLVVVDMQNDFIDGTLGTSEAKAIVPKVIAKLENFDGKVIFTRDTHWGNYLESQEGKNLPVMHCIKGTEGWLIREELEQYIQGIVFDKPTFGSRELGEYLTEVHEKERIDSVTFVGLCTDICVISNALLVKAYLPEVPLFVDASCCAGVTPQSHKNALEAMKMCQITIENE